MLKLLGKRERLLFYVTAGLLVSWICFHFIVKPLAARNAALDAQIREASSRLSRYLGLLDRRRLIESDYEKKKSGLGNHGVAGDAAVEALAELEVLAKGAGIQILEIRPESRDGQGFLSKKQSIDLRAKGSIEGFMSFLYHLGNSTFMLRVEKLQLIAQPPSDLLEAEIFFSVCPEP